MTNKTEIEQLFKTHYQQLRRMAAIFLHDDDSARDVVHDVFASLLYLKRDFHVTLGYLLGAVRNRCINRLRNLDTQSRIKGLYFLENEEYMFAENGDEAWPDEETISKIYEVIQSDLTPQTREIMELRFKIGIKYAEIAERLNVSENTVYKHVRRAIVIIRKKLSDG